MSQGLEHPQQETEDPMKTVKLEEFLHDKKTRREVLQSLENGGLVCLPCNGTYRILADLQNVDAVTSLFQSKRRVRKAPALVFIHHKSTLSEVCDDIDPKAQKLADSLWPGPLTLLIPTHKNLPRKITKQLDGGRGNKIGVRIPEQAWLRSLIQEFGRPLLVSSANREKKGGETSPAQIRKNFTREVDVFIEDGELKPVGGSTVVEIIDGEARIVRAGALEDHFIHECVASL